MLILPWLNPRLSQSLVGVLMALGYQKTFARGEVIYESPRIFDKLMFIQQGLVGKQVLDPVRQEPLLVNLAGSGALCGAYENLYVYDRIARLHVALTPTHVLMINTTLLLQIADANQAWQTELSNYASMCALSDRLGMVINHSQPLEVRMGALAVLMLLDAKPHVQKDFENPRIEWVKFEVVPSTLTLSRVLACSVEQMRQVIQQWRHDDKVRIRSRQLWLNRQVFYGYWAQVEPFLQDKSNMRLKTVYS